MENTDAWKLSVKIYEAFLIREIKSGGDTIKLGDDYAAYKITVENYDSGDYVNPAKQNRS